MTLLRCRLQYDSLYLLKQGGCLDSCLVDSLTYFFVRSRSIFLLGALLNSMLMLRIYKSSDHRSTIAIVITAFPTPLNPIQKVQQGRSLFKVKRGTLQVRLVWGTIVRSKAMVSPLKIRQTLLRYYGPLCLEWNVFTTCGMMSRYCLRVIKGSLSDGHHCCLSHKEDPNLIPYEEPG